MAPPVSVIGIHALAARKERSTPKTVLKRPVSSAEWESGIARHLRQQSAVIVLNVLAIGLAPVLEPRIMAGYLRSRLPQITVEEQAECVS